MKHQCPVKIPRFIVLAFKLLEMGFLLGKDSDWDVALQNSFFFFN